MIIFHEDGKIYVAEDDKIITLAEVIEPPKDKRMMYLYMAGLELLFSNIDNHNGDDNEK